MNSIGKGNKIKCNLSDESWATGEKLESIEIIYGCIPYAYVYICIPYVYIWHIWIQKGKYNCFIKQSSNISALYKNLEKN